MTQKVDVSTLSTASVCQCTETVPITICLAKDKGPIEQINQRVGTQEKVEGMASKEVPSSNNHKDAQVGVTTPELVDQEVYAALNNPRTVSIILPVEKEKPRRVMCVNREVDALELQPTLPIAPKLDNIDAYTTYVFNVDDKEDSKLPNVLQRDTQMEVTSENSESSLSFIKINSEIPIVKEPMIETVMSKKLGPGCALEVNILEKHAEKCIRKKSALDTDVDNKMGSYDVIGRIVYDPCSYNKSIGKVDRLNSSRKGFKLNELEEFKKPLSEKRSRVEVIPLLAPMGYTATNTIKSYVVPTTSSHVSNDDTIRFYEESNSKPALKTEELQEDDALSVYLHTKREDDGTGSFKKLHYTGDSCKLTDPATRSKQILQMSKIAKDTEAAAKIAAVDKKFSTSKTYQQFPLEPNSSPITMSATSPNLGLSKLARDNADVESITSEDLIVLTEPQSKTDRRFKLFKKKPKKTEPSLDINQARDSAGRISEFQPKRRNRKDSQAKINKNKSKDDRIY